MAKIPHGAVVVLDEPHTHTPERLAVEASLPPKGLSPAEMTAARAASAAAPSKAKDLRHNERAWANSEEAPEPDALDPHSKLGATALGAVQGGTLNFGDELGAGVVAAVDSVARRIHGIIHPPAPAVIENDDLWPTPHSAEDRRIDQEMANEARDRRAPTIADTYRGLRDSLRADNATAEKEHPLLYGGSQLVTGALLPVPGSAAMKGASLATKVGIGAAQGVGLGGAFAAGQSQAPTWGGVVADTGKGALIGAPAGALGGAVAHGMEALGPHFSNKAGERAVQAVGARAGINDRLASMGVSTDEVSALGNRFLDAGLVPSGFGLGNPQAASLAKAQSLMKKSGSKVGELLADSNSAAEQRIKDVGDAFSAAQSAPVGPAGDSARAFAAKALAKPSLRFNYDDAAAAASSPLSNLSAAADDAAGKAHGLVDQVRRQGVKTPGDYLGANQLKSDAYKSVNWANEAPIASQLHRKAASGLRQSIEDQVGNALGAPAGAELKAANANFGTAADAEQLASRALSRDVQKQQFSPLRAMISTAAGAGGGFGLGGPGGATIGSVLAPAVTSAIVSRGPNVAAHTNRLLSKAVPALAPEASKLPALYAAKQPQGQIGQLPTPDEPETPTLPAAALGASALGVLNAIRSNSRKPASVDVQIGDAKFDSRNGVPTDSNGETYEEILTRNAQKDEEDRAAMEREEKKRRSMVLAKRFSAAPLSDEDFSVQR